MEDLPIIEDGPIYSVRKILVSRYCGGRLEYLVDWEVYGPEKRSWVPREDILDPTLLTSFHTSHPDRLFLVEEAGRCVVGVLCPSLSLCTSHVTVDLPSLPTEVCVTHILAYPSSLLHWLYE